MADELAAELEDVLADELELALELLLVVDEAAAPDPEVLELAEDDPAEKGTQSQLIP